MDKEDLGAVDEAPESASDPEGADDDDGGGERRSRPVPKAPAGRSVELSNTFQSELHAHQAQPPKKAPSVGRSVQLSQTFQSEVNQLDQPKPKPKRRIPPPKMSVRPIPPPKKQTKERARAERLAKRLRDRKPSGSIPAVRPSAPSPFAKPSAPSRPAPLPKPIPSRNATLDGMPFAAVPAAPSDRPSAAEPKPGRAPITTDKRPAPPEPSSSVASAAAARATIEGPAPTMAELEELAAAEGIDPEALRDLARVEAPDDGATLRPPPDLDMLEPGTSPEVPSPPSTPLETTPASTPRSRARPAPPTVNSEERATDPPTRAPAFASELIESSDVTRLPPSTDPSSEVDLSATFRSEVIAFEEAEAEAGDEPKLTIARRGPTDNEAKRQALEDDDDPFGDLATGSELGGRYRLERIIGRGATGVVFEASHLIIGKRVALKCLYPHYLETPNAVERFFREAKIAATVEHPNVVQVFDGGHSGETMFLAMELLHGETLGERLELGPLEVELALDLFLKVADAVAAVHERGVVHRDLKPDNVFLPEPKGGRPIEPKVLDFGVSKLKEPGRKELTSLGTVLGTPYYMSPEQIRNTRDVDASADVYSLGVMLYEMLAGELPYEGDSVVDIFEAARAGTRTPLDEMCPGLPQGLSQIVDRAMSAEREGRYASARDLHTAVQAVAEAGTDPERDPPTDPKKGVESGITPSPLVRHKPDSVPEREIAALARNSDEVLKPRGEMATVELDRSDEMKAIQEALFGTDQVPKSAPPKKPSRAWIWILVLMVTLAALGVIGAAAFELMR